jgi:hypothetical protein
MEIKKARGIVDHKLIESSFHLLRGMIVLKDPFFIILLGDKIIYLDNKIFKVS